MDLKVYSSTAPIAGLVLAHGAGAGQMSPFMVRAAEELASRRITTATFDFPYMVAGRSVPDRAPVLEDAWRTAIQNARPLLPSLPLFIGGKSMGGRMASHVAAAGVERIAGLVFLGYPLHPPGKPAQRRDAHLPGITEPMLFVQGSADTFGTGPEIGALLPSLEHATLHEIAGGDHSFRVPGGKARQEPAFQEVMNAVSAWIESLIRG